MIDYDNLINGTTETEQPTMISMKAYKILFNLSSARPDLFSDFCNSKRKVSTEFEKYVESQGAGSQGNRMASQVKEVLLKNTHHNFHKSALTGAIGQAYADLCLAVSIVEYCSEVAEVGLSYSEYLSYIHKTMDKLIDEYDSMQQLCQKFPANDIKYNYPEFFELAYGSFDSKTAKNRIERAIRILILFDKGELKYNQQYLNVVDKLKEISNEAEDKIFFKHIVTLIRNRSEFTEEQYQYINDLYMNRFTEEKRQAFLKKGVPDFTFSVEETKRYFFKSKEKNSDLSGFLE